MNTSNRGLLAALGAFTIWGLLPLYWKSLAAAIPLEILCHRITWSTLFTLLLILLWRRSFSLLAAIRKPRTILRFMITALLLSGNWLIYIWAVNSNYIVESSLGYYINPLVNVLLGFFFLKERPRPLQWMALLFACLGVIYLTFAYGRFPWIALALAVTFGIYGLLKKTASLPSLEGLCLETGLLFLPALLTLFFLAGNDQLYFIEQEPSGQLLFAAAGLITSLPLLLFGYAAQRIQLSTLGVIQYLAPTLQLCIGIFVYSEDFPKEQMLGFSLVWFGLLIYAIEGILVRIKKKILETQVENSEETRLSAGPQVPLD